MKPAVSQLTCHVLTLRLNHLSVASLNVDCLADLHEAPEHSSTTKREVCYEEVKMAHWYSLYHKDGKVSINNDCLTCMIDVYTFGACADVKFVSLYSFQELVDIRGQTIFDEIKKSNNCIHFLLVLRRRFNLNLDVITLSFLGLCVNVSYV